MNKENIKKVIKLLKSDKTKGKFNMCNTYFPSSYYVPPRGICIGGWIKKEFMPHDYRLTMGECCNEFFEITYTQGDAMAYPSVGIPYSEIKRKHARKMLKLFMNGYSDDVNECWKEALKGKLK